MGRPLGSEWYLAPGSLPIGVAKSNSSFLQGERGTVVGVSEDGLIRVKFSKGTWPIDKDDLVTAGQRLQHESVRSPMKRLEMKSHSSHSAKSIFYFTSSMLISKRYAISAADKKKIVSFFKIRKVEFLLCDLQQCDRSLSCLVPIVILLSTATSAGGGAGGKPWRSGKYLPLAPSTSV